MSTMLMIGVILAIVGICAVGYGQIALGIVLMAVACVVGPGGYSILAATMPERAMVITF